MRESLRRSKLLSRVVPSALLVAGVVAGCGSSSSSGNKGSSNAPVKVGFFAPETGFAAADGTSAYDAAKLAVANINSSGGASGHKINLVNYDDASDPKQAASIATKLVTQDNVTAVVSGSYSDQTLAAAPIFQRNKTPMLAAYAVNPGIPKAGNYIFQQDFDGTVEGRAGAWSLIHNLHGSKIAIVSIDNDFGHSLVSGFDSEASKLGATIVATDYNQFGEKDFTPIIQRDVSKGANAFYMVQYAAEGIQFIRDWHTLNEKLPMVGTEGLDSETQFVQIAGPAANGIIITSSFDRTSANPETKKFITSFTKKYGHAPDMVSATVYDAFQLLARAMKSGTSADSIRKAIAGTMGFKGITGTINRYTPDGEAVKPVQLEVFRNGAFHHNAAVSQSGLIQP
jgi:branched-chain amino acid transport system substrate-binding protein